MDSAYIEGTAVRKLKPQERRRPEQESVTRRQHRSHRQESQGLSLGYALFLTVACALTLWMCIGYLELQADNTARAKNIASLETQLSDLKDENDDEYNRITTSIDLEKIRDTAINELGMVYADADQVILYDGEGSDYVRQYADIPQEGSTLQDIFDTLSR